MASLRKKKQERGKRKKKREGRKEKKGGGTQQSSNVWDNIPQGPESGFEGESGSAYSSQRSTSTRTCTNI